MKVTTDHSAQMAALKEVGKAISEIVEMFPMYSRATVYRHANRKLGQLFIHVYLLLTFGNWVITKAELLNTRYPHDTVHGTQF